MIDIKPLRYFVTLAEVRHFGRAAELLKLTQPPLSRQLAALEKSVGVKLIERSPRRVELTEAGERFYRDARAILASLNVAEQNAKAIAAGECGQVSVGFSNWAGFSRVASMTNGFCERFSKVRLSVSPGPSNRLFEELLNGTIDVAIAPAGNVDSELLTKQVWTEPLMLALATNRLSRVKIVRAKDLKLLPFIVCSDASSVAMLDACSRYCQARGFTPDIRYRVSGPEDLMQLVAVDAGVAIVPESMCKITSHQNISLKRLEGAPSITFHVVWSGRSKNASARSFTDFAASKSPVARLERKRTGSRLKVLRTNERVPVARSAGPCERTG